MRLTRLTNELCTVLNRTVELSGTDWTIDGVQSEFGMLRFPAAVERRSIMVLETLNNHGVYFYIGNDKRNDNLIFVHDDNLVPVMIKVANEIEDLVSTEPQVLQESINGRKIIKNVNLMKSVTDSFEDEPLKLEKITSFEDLDWNEMNGMLVLSQITKYQEALTRIIECSSLVEESETNEFAHLLKKYVSLIN